MDCRGWYRGKRADTPIAHKASIAATLEGGKTVDAAGVGVTGSLAFERTLVDVHLTALALKARASAVTLKHHPRAAAHPSATWVVTAIFKVRTRG